MEKFLDDKLVAIRHNHGDDNLTQVGVFDKVKKDGLTKNTYITKPFTKAVHILDTTNTLSSIYTTDEKEERIKVLYNYPKRTVSATTTINGKTFTGIAKCHKTDVFNASIGLVIATQRMRIKISEYKIEKAISLTRNKWRF